MCLHSVLLALFVSGARYLPENIPQDATILDLFDASIGAHFEEMSQLPRKCNGFYEKSLCLLSDLTNKQFDKYDLKNDGTLEGDDITKMLEDVIEVCFDTLDNNNDGQIELLLDEILFNIKTDFFRPSIDENWSYLGDDYNIKPSDILPEKGSWWNATDLASWTSLLQKYSNSLIRQDDKHIKKLIDGPLITLINLLDQNNDGYFNKQETIDATIAILKLMDADTDGIDTIDEIIKYAKETGIFVESQLENIKKAIKLTVVALSDKIFSPLVTQVDENNDNMISKSDAKNIPSMDFENTTNVIMNADVAFGHLYQVFYGPDTIYDDVDPDEFHQKVFELAKNTVEDLEKILDKSEGFDNGSDKNDINKATGAMQEAIERIEKEVDALKKALNDMKAFI